MGDNDNDTRVESETQLLDVKEEKDKDDGDKKELTEEEKRKQAEFLEDAHVFRAKVHHFKGIGLKAMDKVKSDNASSDPYLKGSFDHFRTFQSDTIEKTLNPVWEKFDCTFEYETKFPDHLRVKWLTVEIWDKDKMSKDDFMGQVKVDLHSLATGPQHHELKVIDEHKQECGELHFDCEFEYVRNMKLSLANIQISDITYGGSGGDNAPDAYISYHTTIVNADDYQKSERQVTYTPFYKSPPALSPKFTLRELVNDGLEIILKHNRTGPDLNIGRATFGLLKYFGDEPPKDCTWYKFKEELLDDGKLHEKCGFIEGFFGVSGIAGVSGMDGGKQDDHGCHGGKHIYPNMPMPDNWTDN